MPGYNSYYPQQPMPMPTYPQAQPYPQPMQDRINQSLNNYQNALPQVTQPAYTQVQQPMQAQYVQTPQMIGRFVNEFTEVTANDVPMDGKWAIFVKGDMSEIQARAWSPDGKIVPVIFKPVLQESEQLPQAENKLTLGLSDEATEAFMKRFDDISARLEKMERSISKQPSPSTSKSKKEVETE